MAISFFYAFARFAAAAAATVLAIRLLRPLARRYGWLDHPRGRKNHASATPFTGGVAMLIAVLVTLPMMPLASDTLLAFCTGSLLLLAVGLLDDLYNLPWLPRLLAQFGAALLMIYLGNLRTEFIGAANDDSSIALGIFAVPFTLLVSVGIINAINMADGTDGAAGCLTLSSLLLLAAVCELIGNHPLLDRIVIFIGVTVGFLVMNLRHRWQAQAQVFLGNSGSSIVGFALAWLVVRCSQSAEFSYSTVFAPWFVAIPAMDSIALVVRRMSQRRSPFHADQNHLHHLMLDADFSPTSVALILGAASLLLGATALLMAYLQIPVTCQIALFFILTILLYLFTLDRQRAVRLLRRLNLSMSVSERAKTREEQSR